MYERTSRQTDIQTDRKTDIFLPERRRIHASLWSGRDCGEWNPPNITQLLKSTKAALPL